MDRTVVMLIIAITACHGNTDLKITGTYIHKYRDEFSTSYDTLIVSRLANGSNAVYKIQKISSRRKIRGNILLPAKRKIKQWHGAYETGSIQLEPGLNLYFNTGAGHASLGSQFYKKID